MLRDVLVTGLLLALTLGFVWFAVPIVLTALRTGRLRARGTIYERTQQPIMFRLGIAFWVGMTALFALMTALCVVQVISHLGR